MAASIIAACGQSTTTNAEGSENKTEATAAEPMYFGDKITADNAIPVSELAAAMGDSASMNCKISGEIESVCQKKGCWMDIANPNGESVRITFKNYAIFMPKDAAGKSAIMEGIAKVEETSVEDLQEYARDAGKSAEEVAAITSPEKELVFEASGVILQ